MTHRQGDGLTAGSARRHPVQARFGPFLAYVFAFHLTWIAWPYVLYPRLITVGETTLTYAVLNLTIRLVVWVGPVFLYLRFVDGIEPIEYLKLKAMRRRAGAMAAVLTAMNFLGFVARFGLPYLSTERVTWNGVFGTSLLVGVEEIPYRGFMLQKFAERSGFWIATMITSLLFVAVHLPGWLALHTFTSTTAAFIFVFGVIMAVAFKYSRSLWAPILTHSANDCLSAVIYHL